MQAPKRKQPCQSRFGALVLICTVGCQAVAASSRSIVIERNVQIISTQEPVEAAPGRLSPFLFAGDSVGLYTGFDHVFNLLRLLIESGPLAISRKPPVVTNGHEMPFGVALNLNKPVQRTETSANHIFSVKPATGQKQCLRNPGVCVVDCVLDPGPIIRGMCLKLVKQGICQGFSNAPYFGIPSEPF